jgi:hydroxyethylthiazole kinase-like uncharacterized protein yjeF
VTDPIQPSTPDRLLTPEEMAACDAYAIRAGTPGTVLMERAGAAVARAVNSRFAPRQTVVLCGPGNNGGDGYVIARLLAADGWPVRVCALTPPDGLRGDARAAAEAWSGDVEPLTARSADGAALVIDALFGTGLARDLDGPVRSLIDGLNAPVVAVDIPSGVDGGSGAVRGAAVRAALTVTFHRLKPGHLLLPGRMHAGETVVADIGIPREAEDALDGPALHRNGPALWGRAIPQPAVDGHKYARGHAVILGGGRMTGAARFASRAARRVGAGLVSIAAPAEAFSVYAASEPGVLLDVADDAAGFDAAIADSRRAAVLVGPGAGRGERTRDAVLSALKSKKSVVLDADAFSAFEADPETLFAALAQHRGVAVLTPHAGEFARIFGPVDGFADKIDAARQAAARTGAVVVLKGADTVIAAPDGEAAVDDHAPPDLATGGSGDVLAGSVLGLSAQGVSPFEAAAIAVWMLGDAARRIGPGLIADDLPDALAPVVSALRGVASDAAAPILERTDGDGSET